MALKLIFFQTCTTILLTPAVRLHVANISTGKCPKLTLNFARTEHRTRPKQTTDSRTILLQFSGPCIGLSVKLNAGTRHPTSDIRLPDKGTAHDGTTTATTATAAATDFASAPANDDVRVAYCDRLVPVPIPVPVPASNSGSLSGV